MCLLVDMCLKSNECSGFSRVCGSYATPIATGAMLKLTGYNPEAVSHVVYYKTLHLWNTIGKLPMESQA